MTPIYDAVLANRHARRRAAIRAEAEWALWLERQRVILHDADSEEE